MGSFALAVAAADDDDDGESLQGSLLSSSLFLRKRV
jgi:hypothetical protein